MRFIWDEAKNEANQRKHGVSFERAVMIFDGPVITRIDHRRDYGEVRELSIGLLEETVVAAVVHADRNGAIRLISARLASRTERRIYGETYPEAV
jgi:uncharacterized protein